jgi:phosphatidylethanolamine-binding protein (PEBP) family uncharacterized protein
MVPAAVALGGCGGAARRATTASTPARVTIALGSPAVHGSKLPALYTCDGRNVSPPLAWGTVPSGVQELALFALGTRHSSAGRTATSLEWALAGVKPSVHELRAGEIPPGAFLLTGSDGKRGYSLCPPTGQQEDYTFGIFALPGVARASRRIAGAALFHNLTNSSREFEAPAAGVFSVSYTRRWERGEQGEGPAIRRALRPLAKSPPRLPPQGPDRER